MSINRRTAIAVRSIGVASAAAALALGVAGSAFACHIGQFTPSASCDGDHGVITVLDQDNSTNVDITVSQGSTEVGSQKGVKGTTEGVAFAIAVDWTPNTVYTVHVVKSAGQVEVGTKEVTTPDKACASPSPSPSQTTPTTPPETTAPAAPAPTTTAPAAAVADTNAPSPAGGTSNLAETGGGSNTGMIAGVAAVLVAAGGGTVFMLRRRNPAGRH
ncbi:LAETG motif-containing sortase-dependent surface protein [Streptomyces sp. IBSBF 2435]|uniref:LAETG motif-containing sortase-dependent surface protein n=1 Tax=Streptomyces sp. IBSBF 2435 TaxID=2903531 RepID=UPI002FDC2282